MSITEAFFDFGIGLHTPKDFHPHTPEDMLKHKEMNEGKERKRDIEKEIREDPKGLRNHVYIDEHGKRHDTVFADRDRDYGTNEYREYDRSAFENVKWLKV